MNAFANIVTETEPLSDPQETVNFIISNDKGENIQTVQFVVGNKGACLRLRVWLPPLFFRILKTSSGKNISWHYYYKFISICT